MKQPKPILTIKQKCSNSKRCMYGITEAWDGVQRRCRKCKGKGQQEKKIYALRDFEKIERGYYTRRMKSEGYKIPFKDYEIKKVSEIYRELWHERDDWGLDETDFKVFEEHNLKENDKVVIKSEK